MVGPIRRETLKTDEFSAMALGKSSLRSTISRVKACRVGMSKELTAPEKTASTITCQTWTSPANVR